MLDFKTQSRLVDATASIMRAYLRAATNTFAASTSRSLSLWAELLEAGSKPNAPAGPWFAGGAAGMSWTPLVQTWWLGPSVTFWAPLADWGAWSRGPFPAWSGWSGALQMPLPGTLSNGAARPAPDAGFASYRSAGGHAVVQVIVPEIELAGITATTALAPMQTMLGVWRAALRA
jgi:hypothetical protein